MKSGSTLLVKGEAYYDQYARDVMLKAKQVSFVQKVKVVDLAEKNG